MPQVVGRAKWFMETLGGLSPKPHYAWSNSEAIRGLNSGPKRKVKSDSEGDVKIKTCEQYLNKEGKQCYKGTKHLRKTEHLRSIQCLFVLHMLFVLRTPLKSWLYTHRSIELK